MFSKWANIKRGSLHSIAFYSSQQKVKQLDDKNIWSQSHKEINLKKAEKQALNFVPFITIKKFIIN